MKIANWKKWQTFRKDRGAPPWIKVHRCLLSNEQWVSLTDKEKGQLVSLWILAADKAGVIPDDPKMAQRMTLLESPINYNKFIELGFLVDTRLSSGCQGGANMTHQSREEKSRAEKNIDHFLKFWKGYPLKVSKKAAQKVFNKLSADDQAAAAERVYTFPFPGDKKYIPYPERWLSKRRWEDEDALSNDASINLNDNPENWSEI